MPDDQPHITHLAQGATLALQNAEDLFREAAVLFACKAYSRTLFLHQISMEECGKIEILGGWATSQLMGHALNIKRIGAALSSHKAKNYANAYMLPVGEAERSARETSDWLAAIDTFQEQQSEFHRSSNEKKNSALYVDFTDGGFHSPSARITQEMCQELATMNSEFLALVRPKVRMLNGWAKDPEGAQKTIHDFQRRIEKLYEKYPSEPQKVLDLALEAMRAQAKE